MRRVGFGRMILGVRPDYIIRVRADVLEEVDGPMLRHGLQGLEGQRIVVPSRRVDRPDEGRLGEEEEAVFGGGVWVGLRSVYWSSEIYSCGCNLDLRDGVEWDRRIECAKRRGHLFPSQFYSTESGCRTLNSSPRSRHIDSELDQFL